MNNVLAKTHIGFIYDLTLRDRYGEITAHEVVENLMPYEGMNHALDVLLKNGAKVSQWYMGVYGNPYTPTPADVMNTFPVQAGEITSYANAQRFAFTPGTVTNGTVDNAAAPVVITFPADQVVAGGFIGSSAAKGSTSGVLLSAVRFSSPKNVEEGASLTITAGFSFISL